MTNEPSGATTDQLTKITLDNADLKNIQDGNLNKVLNGHELQHQYVRDGENFVATYKPGVEAGAVDVNIGEGSIDAQEYVGTATQDQKTSLLRRYWNNLKGGDLKTWGLTLAVLAAIAGGAYFLLKGDGDDEEEKKAGNETVEETE